MSMPRDRHQFGDLVDFDFDIALGDRGGDRHAAHHGDLGLDLIGNAQAHDDALGEMLSARADAVADRLGSETSSVRAFLGELPNRVFRMALCSSAQILPHRTPLVMTIRR
jgi:hypothetical protein